MVDGVFVSDHVWPLRLKSAFVKPSPFHCHTSTFCCRHTWWQGHWKRTRWMMKTALKRLDRLNWSLKHPGMTKAIPKSPREVSKRPSKNRNGRSCHLGLHKSCSLWNYLSDVLPFHCWLVWMTRWYHTMNDIPLKCSSLESLFDLATKFGCSVVQMVFRITWRFTQVVKQQLLPSHLEHVYYVLCKCIIITCINCMVQVIQENSTFSGHNLFFNNISTSNGLMKPLSNRNIRAIGMIPENRTG